MSIVQGVRNLAAKVGIGHKPAPTARHNARDKFFAMNGGFEGARVDRLTEDWQPGNQSANVLHRMDSAMLRDRARDLVINNPLAKSGVGAFVSNVIERGIAPKPQFDDPNLRKSWVGAWNNWGGEFDPQADITGQQHINELMALWLEEIIVGGGCLLHFVQLPRRDERRISLALELIPEERFADDRDTFVLHQNNKKSANPIIRGIEVDSATGRPIRFWVKPAVANDSATEMAEPISILARDCRYAFFRNRIGQQRGNTMLHAAIMWLWKLGYYVDNELMASAIKSCYAAVITTGDEGDFDTLGDANPDSSLVDSYGNPLEKLSPGIIARLRNGEKITGVGPNNPGGDQQPWILFIERCIAVAMGLSYEELSRDYSQGNFSSTRASANADRKRFRMMQNFTINNFCMPVWKQFVKSSVLAGVQSFPTPARFASEMDEWLKVKWMTPGWTSVNPKEDALADDINLKNGTDTRQRIIAARHGADWEDDFDQQDREQQAADERMLDHSHAVAQADLAAESNANQPEAADDK